MSGSRNSNKTNDTSQDKPVGNTAATGSKNTCVFQQYRWAFTLHANDRDELIEPEKLSSNIHQYCKEYYFQLEKCPETGRRHYQGCLSLYKKEYLQTTKNIIGDDRVNLKKAKDWNACKNYCKKNKTRLNGPWSHETVWIETIRNLNWWQEICWTYMQETPDRRKIYWIWDRVGNKGKSEFCNYCAIRGGATILESGSYKDIAYCIPDNPKIICFDFPKTIEGRINYTAIEKCKDGRIFSSKYESKMKFFNRPHVFCFANFPPDTSTMSMDRWEIINIDYLEDEERSLEYGINHVNELYKKYAEA